MFKQWSDGFTNFYSTNLRLCMFFLEVESGFEFDWNQNTYSNKYRSRNYFFKQKRHFKICENRARVLTDELVTTQIREFADLKNISNLERTCSSKRFMISKVLLTYFQGPLKTFSCHTQQKPEGHYWNLLDNKIYDIDTYFQIISHFSQFWLNFESVLCWHL